jgi:hypothetical protein
MYSAEKKADVAAAAAYSSLTKYCSYSILWDKNKQPQRLILAAGHVMPTGYSMLLLLPSQLYHQIVSHDFQVNFTEYQQRVRFLHK